MGRRARLAVVLTLLALGTGVALAVAQGPGAGAGQAAAEITAGRWINSAPQTIGGLRGRVVAVEFWTFG